MDAAIEEFAGVLQSAVEDGRTCVVVEGVRDAAALAAFGVVGVVLQGELYLFCERLRARYARIVVLTDLDEEGKKLYRRIKHYCSQLGFVVLDEPRVAFARTKVVCVEGLSRW